MCVCGCTCSTICAKGEKGKARDRMRQGIPGNPADAGIPLEVRVTHGAVRATGWGRVQHKHRWWRLSKQSLIDWRGKKIRLKKKKKKRAVKANNEHEGVKQPREWLSPGNTTVRKKRKKKRWGGSLICARERWWRWSRRRRRRRVQELLYRPQESSRQVVWVKAHGQHLPTCLSLSGCRDYFRTVVTPAMSLLRKGGNSLLLCINHSDAVRHHGGGGIST